MNCSSYILKPTHTHTQYIEYSHRWNSISSKFFSAFCYAAAHLWQNIVSWEHWRRKKEKTMKLKPCFTKCESHSIYSTSKRKGENAKIDMQNICFHRQISIFLPQIFRCFMFVKPFARHFSICAVFMRTTEILVFFIFIFFERKTTWKIHNQQKKMNVFNTCSILGICGIWLHKL